MFGSCKPTIFSCDNQGTVSIAKNPKHHCDDEARRYAASFRQDRFEKGNINVEYGATEDILSDPIVMKELANVLTIMRSNFAIMLMWRRSFSLLIVL